MNQGAKFTGIKGLEGKEPIGAVLTVGHKGSNGAPTDTDRLFVVVPQMAQGIRGAHPAYGKFNDLGVSRPDDNSTREEIDKYKTALAARQTIKGNLVHATKAELFEYYLRAQILPGIKAHPRKAPHCTGDGQNATRWNGKEFLPIVCPNELCEFRQGDVKTCKPFMRFLFQPRWAQGSPLPMPLMKLTSGSWNSVRAFIGFFDYLMQQAHQLGLTSPNFYGLPFVITLSRKSDPAHQRGYPVLAISTDGDLQGFLVNTEQRRKELEAIKPRAALTDGEQQDPIEVAADYATITPGIPGERT